MKNFITNMFNKYKSLSNWKNKGQKGELAFHQNNTWRRSSDFTENTKDLFEFFGFNKDSFQNKIILDLGAGSKLRTKFFNNAKIVALEPLANEYMKIDFSDLKDAYMVISKPAEKFISKLEEHIDYCVSINVLDHCYQFEKIISNLYRYLKKDGEAFLSFDEHKELDDMHPLYLSPEICNEIFTKVGFTILKMTKGLYNKK